MKPQSITLKAYHEFKASHSLEGFELPHFHLWKISAEFKGALPLKTDRVIDLVLLQTRLAEFSAPLENTHLNQTLGSSPTSENMAVFFWEKISQSFPNEHLTKVSVKLCNLDGVASGKATLHE